MRIRSIVTVILLCLGTLVGLTTSATARQAEPVCTDISFVGPSGQINMRTSPTRTLAWNIRMHDPALNDGPWMVNVYAGRKRVDAKNQTYQPHGSVSPRDLPYGVLVYIEAWHTDPKGTEHTFVPNGCIVP